MVEVSGNSGELPDEAASGLNDGLGRWIPCAERMPERQGEKCIVWIKQTGRFGKDISTCAIAEYWVHEPGTHDAETGWYWDDGLDVLKEPTHWMPVPGAPAA